MPTMPIFFILILQSICKDSRHKPPVTECATHALKPERLGFGEAIVAELRKALSIDELDQVSMHV